MCGKVVVVFIVGLGVPQQSFVHLSCVPVEYVAHNKFSTSIKMQLSSFSFLLNMDLLTEGLSISISPKSWRNTS